MYVNIISNINESLTINNSDLTARLGYYLYDGDIITYKESLHVMVLPSSNSTFLTITTAVRQKFLDYNCR